VRAGRAGVGENGEASSLGKEQRLGSIVYLAAHLVADAGLAKRVLRHLHIGMLLAQVERAERSDGRAEAMERGRWVQNGQSVEAGNGNSGDKWRTMMSFL
jgi:hypothetical protein